MEDVHAVKFPLKVMDKLCRKLRGRRNFGGPWRNQIWSHASWR